MAHDRPQADLWQRKPTPQGGTSVSARKLVTPILVLLVAMTLAAEQDCGAPKADDSVSAPATDSEPAPGELQSSAASSPTPRPAPTTDGLVPSIPGRLLSSGKDVADVVDKALPSVVQIVTSTSSGTGFIITTDGLVVTNRHVVGGAANVALGLVTGEQLRGNVIFRHPTLDLAHIQIQASQTFTPIPIGDSDAARLGEEVIAIGYPLGSILGRTPTVTVGIISAKRPGLLQTDAAMNPGNSGGPLLNADGEVVGVVVSKLETDSSGNPVDSIGFAIPVNEVDPSATGGAPAASSPPAAPSAPKPGPQPTPAPAPPPEPMIPGTSWSVAEKGPDPITDVVTVTLRNYAVEHNRTKTPILAIKCTSDSTDGLSVQWENLLRRESSAGHSTTIVRWDDEDAVEDLWFAVWAQPMAIKRGAGSWVEKAKGHDSLWIRMWSMGGAEYNARFDLTGLTDILAGYDADLCN